MKSKLTHKKSSQISHKLLFDSNLSFKARGIFAYLWAKPDDWQVLDLVKQGTEGERSIREALRELKQEGYISWKRYYEYGANGKKTIKGIHYFLDDEGNASSSAKVNELL